ncbi:MAG: carboxypeptidase regulatory-like domain-containing protein [Planctomycetales bacterium]|nr:carboxypeptidase regulatory-like domain-containing protein [Planctomycetales bacterium]
MSFLSLVLLAGCGGNPADYPETAPVTGTVTLDGAPLEGASINFVPATGRSSSGKTDAQGRYELHYTGTIEGAMLGPHRVMIWKEVPDPDYVLSEAERKAMEEGEFFLPLVHALPKRYRGQDSRLSAEVKDTNNVIDFALTSQ